MKPLICLAVLVLTSAKFGVAEEKKAAEARHYESHNNYVPMYTYTMDMHPSYNKQGIPVMENSKFRPVYDKASGQHIIDLLNVDDIEEFISDKGKSLITTQGIEGEHKHGQDFQFGKLNGHNIMYGNQGNNNYYYGLSQNFNSEEQKEGLSNYRTESVHFNSNRLSNFGHDLKQLHTGHDINLNHKHNSGAVLEHHNTKHTSINLDYIGKHESSYGGTIHDPFVAKLNKQPQKIQLETSKHENEENQGHYQIGTISANKPSGANVEVFTTKDKTKTLIDLTKINFSGEIDDNNSQDVPELKYKLVPKKPETEEELFQKAIDSGSIIIKHVPIAYAKYIDKPYPYKIYVEKPIVQQKIIKIPFKVEIPKPVAVEKKIPFPVKVFEQDPKPYPVYKDIPVPVTVYVDKPVPKYVEKPYPVKVVRKKEQQDSDDSKHIKPLTWEEFEAVKASAEKSFAEYYKTHTEMNIQGGKNDNLKVSESNEPKDSQHVSFPPKHEEKWIALEHKTESNNDANSNNNNNNHLNLKPEAYNYDYQMWKTSEAPHGPTFEDTKQYSENKGENTKTTSKGERWSPRIREVFIDTDTDQHDLKSKHVQGLEYTEYPGQYNENKIHELSNYGGLLPGIKENEFSKNFDFSSGNNFDHVIFNPYPAKVFDEKHSLPEFKDNTNTSPHGDNDYKEISEGKPSIKSKRNSITLDKQGEEMLKTLDAETSATDHVTTKRQLTSETSKPEKSVPVKRVSENKEDVKKQKHQRIRNTKSYDKEHKSSVSLSKDELKKDSKKTTTEKSVDDKKV